MAGEARYRPAAPNDGMGNITMPIEELLMDEEAESYAKGWTEQEDDRVFRIGVCNYPTRPATIFAIEAARSLCGGADGVAADPRPAAYGAGRPRAD